MTYAIIHPSSPDRPVRILGVPLQSTSHHALRPRFLRLTGFSYWEYRKHGFKLVRLSPSTP